ncbi:MAG: hypothetical protein WC861_02720 [Candidatus Micrarchaeia archaeon]
MAKTDFFKAFNGSSKLLEANLKGIAIPLALIMLLSMATSLASFIFLQASQFLSPFLFGGPLKSTDSLGIGDAYWLAIAAVAMLCILVTWLTSALSLYIAQYFNAVMQKKKMPENWAGVIAGNMLRTLAMSLLILAIFAVIFGFPAAMVYLISTQYSGIGIIIAGALLFLLAFLLYMAASFFLSPMWLYYAVDKNGFFQSIGKSISLVRGNLGSFFLLYAVFVAISFGAAMFSAVCCFSFIISPVLMALVTALYQITMIRMKLDSEAPHQPVKK